MLDEAFGLEHKVARAVIDLGLSELSIYTYNVSAAMMAHLLGRNDEALSILNHTRINLTNDKLIQKIADKIGAYDRSSTKNSSRKFRSDYWTPSEVAFLSAIPPSISIEPLTMHGSSIRYLVWGNIKKNTEFIIPAMSHSEQWYPQEMSS